MCCSPQLGMGIGSSFDVVRYYNDDQRKQFLGKSWEKLDGGPNGKLADNYPFGKGLQLGNAGHDPYFVQALIHGLCTDMYQKLCGKIRDAAGDTDELMKMHLSWPTVGEPWGKVHANSVRDRDLELGYGVSTFYISRSSNPPRRPLSLAPFRAPLSYWDEEGVKGRKPGRYYWLRCGSSQNSRHLGCVINV